MEGAEEPTLEKAGGRNGVECTGVEITRASPQRSLDRHPDVTERLALRTTVDLASARAALIRRLEVLPFWDASRVNASTTRTDDAKKPIETLFDVTVQSIEELDAVCRTIETDEMPWGLLPKGEATSAKGYFLTRAAELKQGFLAHIGIHLDFKAHNPANGDGQGYLSNSTYSTKDLAGLRARLALDTGEGGNPAQLEALDYLGGESISAFSLEAGSGDIRITTENRTLELDHEGNLFEVHPFTIETSVYDPKGDSGRGIMETRTVPELEELISLNNRKPQNDRVRAWGGISPDVINRMVGKWCAADLTTFEKVGIAAAISSGSEGPSRINPAEYVVKLKVRDGKGIRVVTGEEALLYVGMNGFAGQIIEATIEVYRDPPHDFAALIPIKDPKGRGAIDLSPEYPDLASIRAALESGQGTRVWRRLKEVGEFATSEGVGGGHYIDRLADGVEAMATVDDRLSQFTETRFVAAASIQPDIVGQRTPPLEMKPTHGEHYIRGEEIIELSNLIFILPKLQKNDQGVAINMILWMIEHGCMTAFLANGRTPDTNRLEYELAFIGNGDPNLVRRHAPAAETLVTRKRAALARLGDATKLLEEGPLKLVHTLTEILMAKAIQALLKNKKHLSIATSDPASMRTRIKGILSRPPDAGHEEERLSILKYAISEANRKGSKINYGNHKEALIDEILNLLQYIGNDQPTPLAQALHTLEKEGITAFDPRATEGLTHIFVGKWEMTIARKIREWTAEGPRGVSGPHQSTDGQMMATTLNGRKNIFNLKADTIRRAHKAGMISWLYGHANAAKGADMHFRRGRPVQNPPDVDPTEPLLARKIHAARQREAAVTDAAVKGANAAYQDAIFALTENPDSGVTTKIGEKGMSGDYFHWLLLNEPEKAERLYRLLQRAGIQWNARCPLVMPNDPRRTNVLNIFWPEEGLDPNDPDSYDESITRLCAYSHRTALWQRITEETYGQIRDRYNVGLRERSFIAESMEQGVQGMITNLCDRVGGNTHLDLRDCELPPTLDSHVEVVVLSDPAQLDAPQLAEKRKILCLKDETAVGQIERWTAGTPPSPRVDAIVIDGKQLQSGRKRPFAVVLSNIEAIKHRIALRKKGNIGPGAMDIEWMENNTFSPKQTPQMPAIARAAVSMALASGQRTTLRPEVLEAKRATDRNYHTVAPGPSEICPVLFEKRQELLEEADRLEHDPEGQQALLKKLDELDREVLGIPEGYTRIPTASDTTNMHTLSRSVRPGTTIVASIGAFAERQGGFFAEVSQKAIFIRTPSGTGFNSDGEKRAELLQAVRDAVDEPVVVTLTHNETSRGVRTDVSGLAIEIKKINPNAIIVVDSTSIFPIDVPDLVDSDGSTLIDVLHFSHQKGMGKGAGGNGDMYMSERFLEVANSAAERGFIPGAEPHVNELIQQVRDGKIPDIYSVLQSRAVLEYIRDNGGIEAVVAGSRRKLRMVFDWIDQHADLSCSTPIEDISPSVVVVNVGLTVDTARVVETCEAENIGASTGYDAKEDSLRVFLTPWMDDATFQGILHRIGAIIERSENRLKADREVSFAPGYYETAKDYSSVGLAA